MTATIQSIGEQGLLKLVQRFCPADIIGDDGAVLAITPNHHLVVTTDVLIDNVHFSDRTTPPHSVGWRSAAANLSDLAAMGATPIGLTIGLGLPADTSVAWVEGLYEGIQDCLRQFGGAIVGGDLARSSVRTIAITAFGQVKPSHVLTRSTAQVGDAILVTGYHGSARAGLELLLHSDSGHDLAVVDRQVLVRAHQYPTPQLAVIAELGDRAAGMDSSDGLADAVLQICRSSQVGAILDQSAIPIAPALQRYNSEQAIDWALYGGEDFELVLCLSPDAAQALLPKLPIGAAIIGQITAATAVELRQRSGEVEMLNFDRGFQHF
jgi:thiamine-monophosphate kinase